MKHTFLTQCISRVQFRLILLTTAGGCPSKAVLVLVSLLHSDQEAEFTGFLACVMPEVVSNIRTCQVPAGFDERECPRCSCLPSTGPILFVKVSTYLGPHFPDRKMRRTKHYFDQRQSSSKIKLLFHLVLRSMMSCHWLSKMPQEEKDVVFCSA